jgi:hypothetical protein
MSTDNWIKMSERQPTERDYPIWVYSSAFPADIDRRERGGIIEPVTHWKRAEPTPAPPKEKSQKELDEEAYMNVAVRNTALNWTTNRAWTAALAWEREQVAAILKTNIGATSAAEWDKNLFERIINPLRKRCGLDK